MKHECKFKVVRYLAGFAGFGKFYLIELLKCDQSDRGVKMLLGVAGLQSKKKAENQYKVKPGDF